MSQSQSLTNTTSSDSQIEKLYTEKQYIAITGESLAKARRNRMFGNGCPFVKLGRQVRYRPSDIRLYIDRNVRAMNAPREAA